MRPTLRTFGGVLSPGLASYQVVTGVTLLQPSSDRLPSILIVPAVLEMRRVSPDIEDWARSAWACVNTNNRRAATTTEAVFFVMPLNAENAPKPLNVVNY